MSFEDITIHRDFQIIDGYVQVPPNRESDKRRVTFEEALNAIPGSNIIFLSGSGRDLGRGFGQQQILRLPELALSESYANDPVDVLAAS